MATVSGTELLYKRDTRLGLTTLTFRKRRYHGDERMLSASTGDLRDECVMLDVGLSCPHCCQSVTLTATQSKVLMPDGSRSPPPDLSLGQLTSPDDVQAEASRIVPQIEEGARRIAMLTGAEPDALDPEEVQAEARRIVSEIEEGAQQRNAAQRPSEVPDAASPRPDGHQQAQFRVGDRQKKWMKPAGMAEETEIKIGFSSLPRHQRQHWSNKQKASPGGKGSKLSCSDYESLDRDSAAPTRDTWDGHGHGSAETFNSATNSHVDDAYGSMDSSQYSSQSLASNPARQYYSLPHNVRLETLLVDSMEIEETDLNEEALVNELLCDEILDEEYAKLKARDKRRPHSDAAVMAADADGRDHDVADDEESRRRARRTSDEETATSADDQSSAVARQEEASSAAGRRPASGSGEARARRRASGRGKAAAFQIDDADEADAFRDGSPAVDSDRSTSPETLVDDVLENVDGEIYTADATLRRVFAVGRELMQNGQHSAGRPRQTSKQRTSGSRTRHGKDCSNGNDSSSSATEKIKIHGVLESKHDTNSPGAAGDSDPDRQSVVSSVDFCHEVFLDQVLEALTELEGGFATDWTSDYDSDNTNNKHAARTLFVLGGMEADAERYKELLDVYGYTRRATTTSSCECIADERTPELDSSTERVSSAPYTSPSDGSVSSSSEGSNPDRSGDLPAPPGSGVDRRLFEQLVRDTESLTEELMEDSAAPSNGPDVWLHDDVIRPDKRSPRAHTKGQSSLGSNKGRSSVCVDVVRNVNAVPTIVLSEVPSAETKPELQRGTSKDAGDDVSEDSSDDVSDAVDDVDTSLENLLTCNVIHCSTSDLDEIYVRELNYAGDVDGERTAPEPSRPTPTCTEIDEFVPETDADRSDPLNEEFRNGGERTGSACGRLGERKILEKTTRAEEAEAEEDGSVVARDGTVEVVSSDGRAVVGSELRQYVQSQTRQTRRAHTHDSRLDGCIDQRCQTCDFKPQSPGDIVKKEEFITEEVTLVFKWPKKMSLNREVPFKMAAADKQLVAKSSVDQRPASASDSKGKQQPYRTVHLRRVMRVSDYDVDAPVEAPSTVKTVEYRDGSTEERCLVQTRERDGTVKRVQTDVEVNQPHQCLHRDGERLHETERDTVDAAVTDRCSAAAAAESECLLEKRESNVQPADPGKRLPSTDRARTAECLQEKQEPNLRGTEGTKEDSVMNDIESLAEVELARYEQMSESFSLPTLDDSGLRLSEQLYDVSYSTSEHLMSQNESSISELYGQHLADMNDIYAKAERDAVCHGQTDEEGSGEQMSSEAWIERREIQTRMTGTAETSTDGMLTTSCQMSSGNYTGITKQDESTDETDETGSGLVYLDVKSNDKQNVSKLAKCADVEAKTKNTRHLPVSGQMQSVSSAKQQNKRTIINGLKTNSILDKYLFGTAEQFRTRRFRSAHSTDSEFETVSHWLTRNPTNSLHVAKLPGKQRANRADVGTQTRLVRTKSLVSGRRVNDVPGFRDGVVLVPHTHLSFHLNDSSISDTNTGRGWSGVREQRTRNTAVQIEVDRFWTKYLFGAAENKRTVRPPDKREKVAFGKHSGRFGPAGARRRASGNVGYAPTEAGHDLPPRSEPARSSARRGTEAGKHVRPRVTITKLIYKPTIQSRHKHCHCLCFRAKAETASNGDARADMLTSLNLIPQTERSVVVLNLGKYFNEQPDVSGPCLFAGDEPFLGQRPDGDVDPESLRCPRCSEIRLEDILAMSREDDERRTEDLERSEENRRGDEAEDVQQRGGHPVPCQRCIMLEREIRIKLMELSKLIEELGKRRNQRQDDGNPTGCWQGSEGDMDEMELEKLSRETAENIRILKRGIARLNFYRHGQRTADMGGDIVISKQQQVSEDIKRSGNVRYVKRETDGPCDINSQEVISDKGEQRIDVSSNTTGYGDKVKSDKTTVEWDGACGEVLSCDKVQDEQASFTYSTRVIRKRKAKKLSKLMEVFDTETGGSSPQADWSAADITSPEGVTTAIGSAVRFPDSLLPAAGHGSDYVGDIADTVLSSSTADVKGEPLGFRDRVEIFAENLAKYILFRAKLYIVLENPSTRIPCLQNEQVLTPAGKADNHRVTEARVLTPSGQNKDQRAGIDEHGDGELVAHAAVGGAEVSGLSVDPSLDSNSSITNRAPDGAGLSLDPAILAKLRHMAQIQAKIELNARRLAALKAVQQMALSDSAETVVPSGDTRNELCMQWHCLTRSDSDDTLNDGSLDESQCYLGTASDVDKASFDISDFEVDTVIRHGADDRNSEENRPIVITPCSNVIASKTDNTHLISGNSSRDKDWIASDRDRIANNGLDSGLPESAITSRQSNNRGQRSSAGATVKELSAEEDQPQSAVDDKLLETANKLRSLIKQISDADKRSSSGPVSTGPVSEDSDSELDAS